MKNRQRTRKITIAALLIAIGILIPMISPLKIILEPASFTLASHVSIFIAMFISPYVAVAVAIGTAFGFLLGGFPIVITLRATSHLIFAYFGAKYLVKHPDTLDNNKSKWLYSFIIGVIHSVCEVIVVSAFYFGGNLPASYYDQGVLMSVMGLVGIGTVIHSMVDLELARIVWRALPTGAIKTN